MSYLDFMTDTENSVTNFSNLSSERLAPIFQGFTDAVQIPDFKSKEAMGHAQSRLETQSFSSCPRDFDRLQVLSLFLLQ